MRTRHRVRRSFPSPFGGLRPDRGPAMIRAVPHAVGRLQRHCEETFEPRPVLLEQRVERAGGQSVRRVMNNGEVWFRSVAQAGVRSVEPDCWVLQATLPADELAALGEAITASGFFKCAPEYRPDRAAFYAANEIWTAHLDGREHTVAVRGRPITDIPALSSVADALADALADAAHGYPAGACPTRPSSRTQLSHRHRPRTRRA